MKTRNAKKLDEAKGIYQQAESKNYWLRYSYGGKQVRRSLETEDLSEAIKKAAVLRGQKPPDKPGKNDWIDAVEKYLTDKLTGKNRCRQMRPRTADVTRSILLQFSALTGITSPQSVTLKHLEDFYEHFRKPGVAVVSGRRKAPKIYKRNFKIPRAVEEKPLPMRKGSEATARAFVNRVETFLKHVNALPARVKFAPGLHLEKRSLTLPMPRAQALIKAAYSWQNTTAGETALRCEELAFILIAGFTMGLRRSEIIAIRPKWVVDFNGAVEPPSGRLQIPAEEEQPLANGQTRLWRTKNGQPRSIPLSLEMREFFAKHPEWLSPTRLFCIKPNACGQEYRYDPRRPFSSFMAEQGHAGFNLHAMRHSFITHLAHSNDYSVGQISAWSGDDLKTIQSNYFHGRAPAGALDKASKEKDPRTQEDKIKAVVLEVLATVHDGPYKQKLETFLASLSASRIGASVGKTFDERVAEGVAQLEATIKPGKSAL